MKYIVLVGDGMGDLPLAVLGGKTPLETANIPIIDHLSRHGELFRLQTIPAAMQPGSDIANLSLLGYEPQDFYTGRAPLEAASMGIELADGETAYRCNLVNLKGNGPDSLVMVDFSAGHIPTDESRILINLLQEKLGSDLFRFHPGISYRHLMVSSDSLSGLQTEPPHDHIGKEISKFWQRYLEYPHLKALLTEARALLASHEINKSRIASGRLPANSIWLWGEGKAPTIATLEEQYGLQGSLISAVDLLKGIGVYGGLEIINVEGATGYLDTNYKGKADAALQALEKKDFVFVHVEAPDEAGHQGRIPEKIRAIEDFNSRIVQPIFEGMQSMHSDQDFRLVVCMDHFTPISLRTHTNQPVPVLLFDSRHPGVKSGLAYSEKNGEKSATLLASGREFFTKLLQQDEKTL